MSQSKYKKVVREFRKKDKQYPDRGHSIRPWEGPLREEIAAEIREGLAEGAEWAKKAAQEWGVQ